MKESVKIPMMRIIKGEISVRGGMDIFMKERYHALEKHFTRFAIRK